MNNEEIYRQIVSGEGDKAKILKRLLQFDNFLYEKISQAAVQYGNGTHPKHRVTKYHDFFVNNINNDESVIDLGSGRGDVSYDMAKKTNGEVFGLEMNLNNLNYAKSTYQKANLRFVHGNICKDLPNKHFDVVVLSNVLEHLRNRVELLKYIVKTVTPSKVLLRIPHFEREWMIPVKKELGVKYLLDPTHDIEYTHEEFRQEMDNADLAISHIVVNWGEIWAVCSPKSR